MRGTIGGAGGAAGGRVAWTQARQDGDGRAANGDARSMEDAIEETMKAIEQRMAQQQQQPPPPDPQQQKIEAEMKRDEQRHQLDMQGAQADMQISQSMARMDQQSKMVDLQAHERKSAIDIQKAAEMAAFQRETRTLQ